MKKMKNNFWIEDISPKQMFSELLKEDHSITSFWDIFTINIEVIVL